MRPSTPDLLPLIIRKLDLNKIFEPLTTVRRVLPILWASAPGWTIAALILLILEIVFGLLTLYLIKTLVDAITTMLGSDGQTVDLRGVLVQVAWFGGATLAYLVARSASSLAREAQGMWVADYVARMIHRRAVSADQAFYESPAYFDTLMRARQSGSQRPAQVTSNILLLGKNLIMLAAITVLLASINWLLLPILLVAIIPALLVRVHFTRKLYEWRRRRTPMERRAGYLDWLMTSDINAKELRLNLLGDYLRNQYSDLRRRIRGENLRISKQRTTVELFVSAAATVVFFVALGYLAVQTAEGKNSVGDLVLFLLVFQRAQTTGQEVVGQISRFYEDHLYIGLLFEFLEVSPTITSSPDPQPMPETLAQGVFMENVCFTYPGCSKPVLTDVNLYIPPGKVIALVGANGSGKTSLIKLLVRLYDPTVGRIRVDGHDAREFALDEYRRLYSVIFQDFTRYAATVRENIRFGDIRLPADTREVEDAARRASAEEFVRGLPNGYDTLLGRMFEGGQELSVGQWQKIALARSFMNRSQVIILDEPTSAIDPNAEYELFKNFRERIGGRSALVISHRLSTIRMADYIHVLDQGQIVESGTHEELMARQGTYWTSFSRQGEHYRRTRSDDLIWKGGTG